MTNPTRMSGKEAARLLGCSRVNVYNLINRGELRSLRRADVEAFAAQYEKRSGGRPCSWVRLLDGSWHQGIVNAMRALGLKDERGVYARCEFRADEPRPDGKCGALVQVRERFPPKTLPAHAVTILSQDGSQAYRSWRAARAALDPDICRSTFRDKCRKEGDGLYRYMGKKQPRD